MVAHVSTASLGYSLISAQPAVAPEVCGAQCEEGCGLTAGRDSRAGSETLISRAPSHDLFFFDLICFVSAILARCPIGMYGTLSSACVVLLRCLAAVCVGAFSSLSPPSLSRSFALPEIRLRSHRPECHTQKKICWPGAGAVDGGSVNL